MMNFAVGAVFASSSSFSLFVKLIPTSKPLLLRRGRHHKFPPKKGFPPSQTKISTTGNVAKKNNKTRFFSVLFSDKKRVLNQSERAQGPIYIINIYIYIYNSSQSKMQWCERKH